MRATCRFVGRVTLPCLFLGFPLLTTGCNDESKQSGTQVQVSEEAKAQLNAKRDLYNARAKANPKSLKKR
jgi:hypothetical protein